MGQIRIFRVASSPLKAIVAVEKASLSKILVAISVDSLIFITPVSRICPFMADEIES